ncbi:hypothetical protein BDQ17DRAFT_1433035 [Cyathus striatus]|nr:hypothetical protein BDQ17DRAFT_1433035 [Cyathus striatus]
MLASSRLRANNGLYSHQVQHTTTHQRLKDPNDRTNLVKNSAGENVLVSLVCSRPEENDDKLEFRILEPKPGAKTFELVISATDDVGYGRCGVVLDTKLEVLWGNSDPNWEKIDSPGPEYLPQLVLKVADEGNMSDLGNEDINDLFIDISMRRLVHEDIRPPNICQTPKSPPGYPGEPCPYLERVHNYRIIDFDASDLAEEYSLSAIAAHHFGEILETYRMNLIK